MKTSIVDAIVVMAAILHDDVVAIKDNYNVLSVKGSDFMANRAMCNFLRRPAWWIFVTIDGQVVHQKCYLKKKHQRYVDIPRLDCAVILPDISTLPAIQWKSCTLLHYDKRDAIALEDVDADTARQIEKDSQTFVNRALGLKERRLVAPRYWVETALDTKFLHDWINGDVVEDLMSNDKKEIPWWIFALVGLIVFMALVAVSIYFMTKGGPAPVQVVSPLPTIPPGGGYVTVK